MSRYSTLLAPSQTPQQRAAPKMPRKALVVPLARLPAVEADKVTPPNPVEPDGEQVSQAVTNHAQPEIIKAKNEATFVPINERSNERTKIRHTFDILADQLLALREMAIEREKVFGKRVLLGELVQEALDMFITKERNKD